MKAEKAPDRRLQFLLSTSTCPTGHEMRLGPRLLAHWQFAVRRHQQFLRSQVWLMRQSITFGDCAIFDFSRMPVIEKTRALYLSKSVSSSVVQDFSACRPKKFEQTPII
jgi:hypothetical protein